jgi:PAS domain-containing protein
MMSLSIQSASELVDSATAAVSSNPDAFHETVDDLRAPIYVTDNQGTITYFNKACVELAGRTPELGRDRWCVTWKLFTTGGKLLPHDECPMAVAIREKRAVRDVEAIAERPDGTRVYFVPFPTPYFDSDGNMAGAVNLLLKIDPERRADFLRKQAANCRCLAGFATDPVVAESLSLTAAAYEARASRLSGQGEAF